MRPRVYRALLDASTPEHPVHVIAFDYRGFGISTGSPTESGLILDAETVINYLTSPPLSIPRSHIVIAGQSLGTAVAAGVAEKLTFEDNSLTTKEPLAGVILFAGFTSIRDLIPSYRMGGWLPPLLHPFMAYPRFQDFFLDHIIDSWKTGERVARLTSVNPHNTTADVAHANAVFDLTIMHAANDMDVPIFNGVMIWNAATGHGSKNAFPQGEIVSETSSEDGGAEEKIWEKQVAITSGQEKLVKRVRWEKIKYGGHNEVAAGTYATLAIIRAFEQ